MEERTRSPGASPHMSPSSSTSTPHETRTNMASTHSEATEHNVNTNHANGTHTETVAQEHTSPEGVHHEAPSSSTTLHSGPLQRSEGKVPAWPEPYTEERRPAKIDSVKIEPHHHAEHGQPTPSPPSSPLPSPRPLPPIDSVKSVLSDGWVYVEPKAEKSENSPKTEKAEKAEKNEKAQASPKEEVSATRSLKSTPEAPKKTPPMCYAVIYIKEAKDLIRRKNFLGDPSPMCEVRVGGHIIGSTSVVEKTQNPSWDPPVEVPFAVPVGSVPVGFVKLLMWHTERHHDFHDMGCANLELPLHMYGSYYYEDWLPIEGKRAHGSLKVGLRLSFTPIFRPTGIPSLFADGANDETIVERINRIQHPGVLFPMVPKMVVILKRHAQDARDRIQADGEAQNAANGEATPPAPELESQSVILATDKVANRKRLADRLQSLGLAQDVMADDGNCQFRAMSHQLYGTQEYHKLVRDAICTWIQDNPDTYSHYFEHAVDYQRYVTNMRKDRTWGDEMTLKAAADAFHTDVHVVTSTVENWYLHYKPDSKDIPKSIFLAYISPVHYNSLVFKQLSARGSLSSGERSRKSSQEDFSQLTDPVVTQPIETPQ